MGILCVDPPIVGEVTAHAQSEDEVSKLLRKAEAFKRKYGAEPQKYLIILTAARGVVGRIVELCGQHNIRLILGRAV